MSDDPFYTSRCTVRKIAGPLRRATLPTGVDVELGVHGAIRAMYDLPGPDRPLPVDYIVAATGG